MKTKILLFVTMIICVFGISASALTLEYNGETHEYTGSVYSLMVNGKYIETSLQPIIFNDRALVPIRDVFEAMGATVKYLDASQQIFIDYNKKYLRLKIGSDIAYIDANQVNIPGGVTPMLIAAVGRDAKTMVPVRFVSESLGFDVQFDGDNGVIKITDPETGNKSTIYNYKCSSFDDLTATMELYLDTPVSSITSPVYTDGGVLYFDVPNATHSLAGTTQINIGAIKQLRMGIHDGYARVALDLENCKSYNVALSGDKKTILIAIAKFENTEEVTAPNSGNGKIVVIDAGHGGSDPGASGSVGGKTYQEKSINLAVAKKVRDILSENGVTVLMTRDSDTYPSLTQRSDFANANKAVIFTSIHSNSASSSSASGFEVYYSVQNNSGATGLTSAELAASVAKNISKNVSIKNRGVKTENHVVTRTSTMPAILVELGFMSNPDELSLLLSEDFQYSIAKGIADGILAVIGKANPPQ